MWSRFYQSHSRKLLLFLAITFPVLFLESHSIPSNNDIETWLPDDHAVREAYDNFKLDFGAEEVIIISLPIESEETGLSEAVANRVARLPAIKECYTPQKLTATMSALDVAPEVIEQRLSGLCRSRDEECIALMALLSEEGVTHRAQLVSDLKSELAYCQIAPETYRLSGAPIVVTELDRLGNAEESGRFFALTLLICLLLLYHNLKDWKLTLVLLGQTMWAIELSGSAVKWCGGESNFILGAMKVMVMVFTLAASIHVVHYFRHSRGANRLDQALRLAWKPCFLAMITTAIGLASLMISEMAPVRQFGFGAALGAIVSLIVGFGVTPAALVCWPVKDEQRAQHDHRLSRLAFRVVDRSRLVVVSTVVLILVCGAGLFSLNSRIDPLDFLPRDGKVIQDHNFVESQFASTASIEVVVDFGGIDMPFADKLNYVRTLSREIESHPSIEYAVSAATFFPEQLPTDAFEAAALLNDARQAHKDSDFLARGERLWRISARFAENVSIPHQETIAQLQEKTDGKIPIHFTGMEILLEHAQQQIFTGFWQSFATAFLIITAVMVVSLRSLKAGLVAMIPNLTPVCLIFGLLGWFGIPVEIGTMMTGSIALGLAVDGTFHYLVRYNEAYRGGDCSTRAARKALLMTGGAIFNASTVTAVGMLALGLSSFTPTARFGYMMTALTLAAVVGDLVLLPALLSLRPQQRQERRRQQQLRGPHAAMHEPQPVRETQLIKKAG